MTGEKILTIVAYAIGILIGYLWGRTDGDK